MKVSSTPIAFRNNKLMKCGILLSLAGASATAARQVSNISDDKLQSDLENMAVKNNLVIRQETTKSRIEKIRTILKKAIENGDDISIAKLSKLAEMTEYQIIHLFYHQKNGLRELYDQVKRNLPSKILYAKEKLADTKRMTSEASKYLTNYCDTKVEEDYIQELSKHLMALGLEKSSITVLGQYFSKYPGFTDLLISSTDNNSHRLGYYKSANKIKHIFDAYELNPELTEKMLFEKTDEGNFKYLIPDIINIINITNLSPKLFDVGMEQPEFVKKLISYQINGKPRFGIDNIIKLAEYNKESPKFLEHIIGQKNESYYPRFSDNQIIKIMDMYKNEPKFISKLVNTKVSISNAQKRFKFSSKCIEKIIDTYNEGIPSKIRLLNKMLAEKPEVFPYETVPELPSAFILEQLDNYDKKKYWFKKFITEDAKSDEFIDEFEKDFGDSGLKIVNSLFRMGFSKQDIKRMLERTGIKIYLSKNPWENHIYIENKELHIEHDLSEFVVKTNEKTYN